MDQIIPGDIIKIRTPCRISRLDISVDSSLLFGKFDEIVMDSRYTFMRVCDLNHLLAHSLRLTNHQNQIYVNIQNHLFVCGNVGFVLDVVYGKVFDVELTNSVRKEVQLTTFLYQEKKYLFASWTEETKDFLRKIA